LTEVSPNNPFRTFPGAWSLGVALGWTWNVAEVGMVSNSSTVARIGLLENESSALRPITPLLSIPLLSSVSIIGVKLSLLIAGEARLLLTEGLGVKVLPPSDDLRFDGDSILRMELDKITRWSRFGEGDWKSLQPSIRKQQKDPNPRCLPSRAGPNKKNWKIDQFIHMESVIFIQNVFRPWDDLLAFISSASNPASVLHYVLPILSVYDVQLATELVSAYALADVTNLLFKWPLKGDRPYWVRMPDSKFGRQSFLRWHHVLKQMDPNVRQFGANTCEVGYGLPSGHMQVG
jgi:hypothetical protein